MDEMREMLCTKCGEMYLAFPDDESVHGEKAGFGVICGGVGVPYSGRRSPFIFVIESDAEAVE